MKKDKIKEYLILTVLVTILLFALFVPNTVNRRILAVIISVFAFTVHKFIKKRNIKSIYSKQVLLLMLASAIIYLVGYYVMGIYFGFYKSTVQFGWWAIGVYIIPTLAIVISSEVIRNIFVVRKSKIVSTLLFISMLLVDLIMYAEIYDIKTLDGALAIIGYVLFASISCNLLYNYTSKRFGALPIIAYRIITIIYAYVIPITPDIYIFFKSFLRMIYPYFIYLLLEALYAKSNIVVENNLHKRRQFLANIFLVTFMVIIIMLVSCRFRYGVLVIASGSMTGTINVGDIIFYEQYDNQKIEKGQIVMYEKDGMKIIHRVIDILNVNGEARYVTRGDNNDYDDDGYRTIEQITGVFHFKISYLGYPSLWIKDLFTTKQ